jgi:hypothetical protein
MKNTRTYALWGGGIVAALVLTLGVNGTLSSWTQAVITNDNNTVTTGSAVILKETSGANTCLSSTSTTNQSTCSTINKYGGTATPLTPGTNQQVDVTFTNVGSVAGSSFVLAPAACSQAPTAGSGSPPAANLCTNGDLTVTVGCSDGTTFTSGSAWTDLKFGPGSPGSFAGGSYTHTAAFAVNASATCRFTVALASGAGPTDQGITVSQVMSWTLNR